MSSIIVGYLDLTLKKNFLVFSRGTQHRLAYFDGRKTPFTCVNGRPI
jgi:hypothetical protein